MRAIRLSCLALIVGLVGATPARAVPTFFDGNAYEFIPDLGISFEDARNQSELVQFQGVNGHLVTIFSQEENDFVLSLLSGLDNSIWLGATDLAVEGEWRWVTGEQFWQGDSTGMPGPDVFYANWSPFQPDDFGTGQDLAKMFGPDIDLTFGFLPGEWDDGGGGIEGIFGIAGYVVEFDLQQVPEPSTSSFLVLAIAAWIARRRL